ncbi:MAG: DNA polymerase ligase N-terminal domain-containing protein [Pirellulaceae bacterium]
MTRYVILRHAMPSDSTRPDHWDLLLETGEMLTAWALVELPTVGTLVAATRLADHRRDYLEYEGPISENRGSVARWDAGHYRVEIQTPNRWRVDLCGMRLDGVLDLQQLADESDQWTARWEPRRSHAGGPRCLDT